MADVDVSSDAKWADIEAEDDYDAEHLSAQHLSGFETAPDADGIKTVTCYTKNARGQTVKVTKRVKEIIIRKRVHKSVETRKNLPHFNIDEDAHGVVMVSTEDISIEVPKDKDRLLRQDDDMECIYAPTDINQTRAARELKQKFKSLHDDRCFGTAEHDDGAAGGSGTGLDGGVDGDDELGKPVSKFIPSHRREGFERLKNFDEATIRVTNLSEDVKEKDLTELFGKIGRIQRAYLAKHKETQNSKGFAFITYYDRSDAIKAINKFNRYGYDNLLLNVSLAQGGP